MARVRQGGSARWRQNAGSASATYAEGVSSPRRPWQQATAAAAGNFAAGIQAAITQKAFEKGVNKAGNERWQNNAINKGAQRYVQGVQQGESDYASGFAKYQQVIENTQLPPRFPKGDPRNLERVNVIATNLRKAKVSG